ncbi:MAG: transglycosylase domain-containing protein [Spirochaetota bacterium]|nr:transglycosylase domain-containing protein [Spirochaetota bacterium]
MKRYNWKHIDCTSANVLKASLVVFVVAIVTYIIFPYKDGYLTANNKSPITIYDRHGLVLMEITDGKKGLSQSVKIQEVPSEFIDLLLFSEDRNFYDHWGISLKGIARALYQNLQVMHIVSGGSTITQQLVKSKKEIVRNTAVSKLAEIIEAIRLECHFSKKEILQTYINEVYMGNNIYGFEKAAQVYFDKHLYQCDLLEQAFLISLVKAPEWYNPYKNPETIVKRARMLLDKASRNVIKLTPLQQEAYRNKKIYLQYDENTICAPLFCLYALSKARELFPGKDITKIYTTLDAALYKDLLAVVRNSLSTLKDKNALHAAIVMIDNKTMEIMAMIGSVDFFDYGKGQVDATLVKKQVASTMKPFAYALALDKGIFHTSSILPDVYTQFYSKVGNYIPKNFSQSYHGPIRLAKALGCSYNIPAVYVINTVGMVPFYNFIRSIGFDSINRSPSFYGLGIVLGNAEVTLLELANAYTIFPREGIFEHANCIRKIVDRGGKEYVVTSDKGIRVLQPSTCYLINHILSEYKYKVEAFGLHSAIHFPFPFAAKTGTSKDFKDNFVAGYNKNITCAVWVGNLYNETLDNLPAVSGAGIVLKNILLHLWNSGFPFAKFTFPTKEVHEVRICMLSGLPATPFCPQTEYELYAHAVPKGVCTWHSSGKTTVPAEYVRWAAEKHYSVLKDSAVRIIFPKNGATFKIDKTVRKSLQAIPLQAAGTKKEIQWFVDGHFIGKGNEIVWQLQQGNHRICARSDKVAEYVNIVVLE